MRYSASEKLEIIHLVEQSHLPVKATLGKLGIARPTFYRWYDLYQRFGEIGLEDKRSGPNRAWNRIPDKVQSQIIDLALERPELSPRELAATFTDCPCSGYPVELIRIRLLTKSGSAMPIVLQERAQPNEEAFLDRRIKSATNAVRLAID